jgi:hypothetical protein
MAIRRSLKVVIQLDGGLGNQLFQYCAGFVFSQMTGRQLVLDNTRTRMGNFVRNRLNANMTIFGAIPLIKSRYKIIKNPYIHPFLSINSLARKVPFYRSSITFVDLAESGNIGTTIKSDDLLSCDTKKSQIRLRGYMQSWNIVKESLNLGFLKTLDLDKEINISSKLVDPGPIQNAIAIHFRLKDYSDKGNDLTLPLSFYRNAIELAEEKYFDSPLWYFTDDIEMLTKFLPETLLEKATEIIGPESASDIDTFLLISKAKCIVMGNSSFSYWASVISKAKTIYCPKPWFKNYGNSRETIEMDFHEDWIAINW